MSVASAGLMLNIHLHRHGLLTSMLCVYICFTKTQVMGIQLGSTEEELHVALDDDGVIGRLNRSFSGKSAG